MIFLFSYFSIAFMISCVVFVWDGYSDEAPRAQSENRATAYCVNAAVAAIGGVLWPILLPWWLWEAMKGAGND